MLHLPLDYPRGLLHKTPRQNKAGVWALMYAYPFVDCHKLSMTPSKGPGRPERPRELMPAAMFSRLREAGVLHKVVDYDRAHEKGEAMRRRPTFALQEMMELF